MEHVATIPGALPESQKTLIREAIIDFNNDGNREQLKQRLEYIVKPHYSGNFNTCGFGFPPWLWALLSVEAFYLIKKLIDQFPVTVEFKIRKWFHMKFCFRKRRKKQ